MSLFLFDTPSCKKSNRQNNKENRKIIMSGRGKPRKRPAKGTTAPKRTTVTNEGRVASGKVPKKKRKTRAEPEAEHEVARSAEREELEIVHLGTAMDSAGDHLTINNNSVRTSIIDFQSSLDFEPTASSQPNLTMPTAAPSATVTGTSPDSIWCAADDIFIHVPIAIRRQIWSGSYINMALLLKGAMELNDICSGSIFQITANGTIEAKAKECKEKVQSIAKWTDAFMIFMAVYLKQHAAKAGEMLQYMALIREAAVRHGDYHWRTYDEQFRIRQATSPMSWAKLNQDL